MLADVFERLRLREPIQLIGLPEPFYVLEKFECGNKIEVSRHKKITRATLAKWVQNGNPIAEIKDIDMRSKVTHLPSGFEYVVDLVDLAIEHASAIHTRIVSIEEADAWELYKPKDDE